MTRIATKFHNTKKKKGRKNIKRWISRFFTWPLKSLGDWIFFIKTSVASHVKGAIDLGKSSFLAILWSLKTERPLMVKIQ
jgi:hypothetical protein